MRNIKSFIEINGLECGWRGYRLNSFIVWVPFEILPCFLSNTKILNHAEYGHLGNCGICEHSVAIDLTESFYEEDIEAVFPKIMD